MQNSMSPEVRWTEQILQSLAGNGVLVIEPDMQPEPLVVSVSRPTDRIPNCMIRCRDITDVKDANGDAATAILSLTFEAICDSVDAVFGVKINHLLHVNTVSTHSNGCIDVAITCAERGLVVAMLNVVEKAPVMEVVTTKTGFKSLHRVSKTAFSVNVSIGSYVQVRNALTIAGLMCNQD